MEVDIRAQMYENVWFHDVPSLCTYRDFNLVTLLDTMHACMHAYTYIMIAFL